MRRGLALAATIGSGLVANVALTPYSTNAAAPAPTGLSFYFGGATTAEAQNAGCAVASLAVAPGQQKLTGVIGFGAPRAAGGASNWSYPDYTSAQIKNLTREFMNGFMYCIGSTGDANSFVRVVVATTNDSDTYANNAHGAAWGAMVNSLQADVNAAGWGTRVHVRGGSDIEPSFNASVANTKAWVSGFVGVSGLGKFVGNNSLDGCPTTGTYTAATSCNAPSSGGPAWKVDDLWFVSGQTIDTSMNPVPQIYNNAQAQQWYRMAKYTKTTKGYKMYFLNTMSQAGACAQMGCSTFNQNQSYDALQNLLNADSSVTVTIEGDTDVRWL